jgi:hypothetical protein
LSFCNTKKNLEIILETNFPIIYFSNNNISKKAAQNSKIKKIKSLALLDPKIKPTYRTLLTLALRFEHKAFAKLKFNGKNPKLGQNL